MRGDAGSDTCPNCGRKLDEHNRHVRFVLPDPVLEVPESEREARSWGNEVLLQVQGVGAFVRVLLPVRLSGGYTVTFGAWLAVHPEDLRRAWRVWWSDEYPRLELRGYLANAIPPWGLLRAPAVARVRHPDQAPYLVESPDQLLGQVLENEWPHEPVLAVMP